MVILKQFLLVLQLFPIKNCLVVGRQFFRPSLQNQNGTKPEHINNYNCCNFRIFCNPCKLAQQKFVFFAASSWVNLYLSDELFFLTVNA